MFSIIVYNNLTIKEGIYIFKKYYLMLRFPKPSHLQSTMGTIGLSMNKRCIKFLDLLCKSY